jgi:predicted transcriptional regulator
MATKEFYRTPPRTPMAYSWTGTVGAHDTPDSTEGSHNFSFAGMNERRRSRLDICYELMEGIRRQGSAKPTQLMYSANLSWKTLTELLSYLSDRGLVRWSQVGARRTLSITELGASCLDSMRQVHSVLVPDGQGAPVTHA